MRRPFTSRNFGRELDRIEKAVELINAKQVQPVSEGLFAVLSQGEQTKYSYGVTLVSCECDDFHFTTELCKHQWASWGAPAAQFIMKIRASYSFKELEAHALRFADSLTTLPANFLAVVREEYRKRMVFIYESGSARRAS